MKLESFVSTLQKTYGANLLSVILYGSAAGVDFQEKYSDYNLLVLLNDLNPKELSRSAKLCQKWMGWRRKNPPPVFVDPEYVKNSRDVFPLEFSDMKACYKVLQGEDPLADLQISNTHLRLQCESELKGKILGLREAFLQTWPSRRKVRNLILHSASSLFALFRGFLRLLGEEVPKTKRQVLAKLNAKTHFDTAIFERILDVRDGKRGLPRAEVQEWMEEYLTTLKKMARVADAL